MTEPKYVKISEELRDQLEGLVNSHMHKNNDDHEVVIWCIKILDDLSAAPSVETLDSGLFDLQEWAYSEGFTTFLEEHKTVIWNLQQWIWKKLSILTKPEQSGGVVTREVMSLLEVEKFVGDWDFAQRNGGSHLANLELLRDRIYARQFPASPMQASEARGVEIEIIRKYHEETLMEYHGTGGHDAWERHLAFNAKDCPVCQALAHLQQAPQGVSVPTMEELINVFHKAYFLEHRMNAGIEAIHSLLTALNFPKDKP